MSLIDENMAEQAALDWFEALGYERVFGPDIAPDGTEQERESYKHVVLADRLMTALVWFGSTPTSLPRFSTTPPARSSTATPPA